MDQAKFFQMELEQHNKSKKGTGKFSAPVKPTEVITTPKLGK